MKLMTDKFLQAANKAHNNNTATFLSAATFKYSTNQSEPNGKEPPGNSGFAPNHSFALLMEI